MDKYKDMVARASDGEHEEASAHSMLSKLLKPLGMQAVAHPVGAGRKHKSVGLYARTKDDREALVISVSHSTNRVVFWNSMSSVLQMLSQIHRFVVMSSVVLGPSERLLNPYARCTLDEMLVKSDLLDESVCRWED